MVKAGQPGYAYEVSQVDPRVFPLVSDCLQGQIYELIIREKTAAGVRWFSMDEAFIQAIYNGKFSQGDAR